ncbi:MAG: 2-oxo-4-hydroxy-4-carboxy-5-ureidoimidazoline decarboxylase [Dongiaceae bacterium]
MASQFFRKRPTAMTRPEFVARFGGVYEHSPWVAETVYDARLRPAHDGVKALHAAMIEAVETAPRERRLELLRAHPDLAGRLAVQGGLTAASTAEQASAGLDACTPQEFARFQELNAAYRARFGFPFIMAVRGRTRAEILAAFERRLPDAPEAEFRTALDEVHKIALLRLGEL